MTLLTELVPDGFNERAVEVAGRVIRYLDGGEGDVLLVLHGGLGWLANMAQVHRDLARDHRVIAPELPGFGGSSAEGIDSIRELSGVVARWMTALGIERCSVLGTSMGATVALWLAIDTPQAVEKLVLEAPLVFREAVPTSGPSSNGGPEPDPALAFANRLLGSETDPTLVDAMTGCEVTSLVLLSEDDVISSAHFAADYKCLPGASVAIVYHAGDDIKASRPEAYLAIVRDFLRRGSSFVVKETSSLLYP